MSKPYSVWHRTAAEHVLAALKYGACKVNTLARDMGISADGIEQHVAELRKRGYVIYTVGKHPNYAYELQLPFADDTPVHDAAEADRYKRRGEGLT